MNLETFRKNMEANEVYKEKMPLVRIAIENQFVLYQEMKDLFEAGGYFIEEFNTFSYSKYAFLQSVTRLYNEIGKFMDNQTKNFLMDFSIDVPNPFTNIYKEMQEINNNNNIDFVYAILFFTNFILKDSEIYEYFVKDIFKYLKEHELSELIKWTRTDNRKTVFVAMSFHESMKNARKKITEAVESFGYQAMLIDIKEHNNQIVPEIFTEIKKSKFVVADLTGQRGGVYFEAGYAKALEKDLILCCKKEEQEKVHFDVAQINTIFWENENDLYERLRKRIESTIETETYF